MSKLTKEEVISQLEGLLSSQKGQTVSIEQKGSWYKIDGGKSLRFSELEAMFAEFNHTESNIAKSDTAIPNKKDTQTTPKIEPKSAAKKTIKVATIQHNAVTLSAGQTPKELWLQKLAGQGQLPRGF
ncbi:hypothetical protein [Shewanella surugensis]|uniref:Uncharacterized protein n=1 Tax=Shewanella surugensis TaxID=212020 RepID=A0ABT0L7A0_9GAMM|nr:hypothetical protein [Shewanella surugensis]MCL1123444.1 hypothetical protein [Shewanella surugensis]